MALRLFDPPPAPGELPDVLPSPFSPGPPHPLARRAADELIAELRAGLGARLGLDAPGGGKMFGVLVVAAPDGRVGYLRAFSGMAAGTWELDDFAPATFDIAARDAFWPDGERELAALDGELATLDAELAEIAAHRAALDGALDDLRTRHRLAREARRALRTADPARGHELDQQSRADTAERRRFDEAVRTDPRLVRGAELQARRDALVARKADRSRHYLHAIQATYILANARGERRPLRELFARDAKEPPGGAGDCAAPKLLALAYARALRPLALAELWWGAPPLTGGRHGGHFYPACRGKCGPILAHMLAGLPHEPAPVFGDAGPAELPVLHEDRWLIVVAKPAGLLSVPGRGALRDSVQTRLGVKVVHRLDLDTSGVLLAARDDATYAALQRLFATRAIDKRYVAVVEGRVAGERGTIELPLRLDVDDRPRQVVDPVHGKHALTEWHVLARDGERTRVALHPRTGRAHQLRVHAAHPAGLAAPIVGDRLYGRPGDRLLLHAEALAFVHPHTGEALRFEHAAPF